MDLDIYWSIEVVGRYSVVHYIPFQGNPSEITSPGYTSGVVHLEHWAGTSSGLGTTSSFLIILAMLRTMSGYVDT